VRIWFSFRDDPHLPHRERAALGDRFSPDRRMTALWRTAAEHRGRRLPYGPRLRIPHLELSSARIYRRVACPARLPILVSAGYRGLLASFMRFGGSRSDERTRQGAADRSPDLGSAARGPDDLRRQRPRHEISADPAIAPAVGRAECPHRAHRRRRLWRLERLRRSMPNAELREARRERPPVHPVPHDGALLADPSGDADRPQPSFGGYGRHHGNCDLGARIQLDSAEHLRAARAHPQAQRLLDRAVRQMPRGACLADKPDGSVRRLAQRWRRVRVFLWIYWRRDQPVLPSALRRHHADRAGEIRRAGLSLDRRPDDQGDQLDTTAKGN